MFAHIFIKIFTFKIVFAKIVVYNDSNVEYSNMQERFRQFFIYTRIMVAIYKNILRKLLNVFNLISISPIIAVSYCIYIT